MAKVGAPPGNKNGSRKNRVVSDSLSRVVTQNPNKIRKACEALLDRAVDGDIAAFREIFDRLEGKPIQAVEGSGDNGEIILKITTDDEGIL